MRVALLSFNFGQYCINLANGLAKRSQVRLALPRSISAPYRHGLDPAVSLFQFDQPRLRQPLRHAAMTRAIVRDLRGFNPDVIHYQAGHLWFNLAWPALGRYPLVVTIHETRHHLGDAESKRTPQRVMDIGYRRADRIVVHGQRLRDDAVADLGIPRVRIDVIPAVPDVVLPPGMTATGSEDDGRTVLFFGRIWTYKGLDYLIRAEPSITERVPDARIVIAGVGEDFERYRREMVHPERFVVHNRFIPDAEMVELFRRATVVVLPYVDGSISGVVPVACTFGKPVVATDVGILPEMVEHDRTGLVVPPRDAGALADAIVRLLHDEDLRRRLGRQAADRAATVFAPDAVAGLYLQTYRHAAGGGLRAA
jgi:starch synthase